jgi:hypothetical protein
MAWYGGHFQSINRFGYKQMKILFILIILMSLLHVQQPDINKLAKYAGSDSASAIPEMLGSNLVWATDYPDCGQNPVSETLCF